MGLFFYSGHGLQVNGANYLVPVQADVTGPADVKYELIDVGYVLDEMTSAGSRLNVVILDACRNNPFAGRGLRGTAQGLAQITAPAGTVIGYATQPGNVAFDGPGGNSPYSAALIEALDRPGLDVFQMFNTIGVKVKAATGGRQQPWLATSPIEGDFFFRPGASTMTSTAALAEPPVPAPARAPEEHLAPPTAPITAPAPAPVATTGNGMIENGMTLDVCPSSYSGFDEEAPSLTCGCSPGGTKVGDVFGANPYYWQSAVCRAALHAGVIGAQGGQVLVMPDKAPVFPAVDRNGVSSRSWKADTGFRVVATAGSAPPAPQARAAPAIDVTGRPIQAPIAKTLRAQRQVQLYINFVTDKADLQPNAEPVLRELAATLTNDPGLRVDLIGHTDSIGSSAHNLELSERRAAAVFYWLVRNGIARDRLRSSGRGFTEPIADNTTLEGRALNRRVEVKALD